MQLHALILAVGALEGLRVVDLSTLYAAPQVSALLADFGADVVKVEPPDGDPLQALGVQRDGASLPYVLANRGKRRVVLDLDDAANRGTLHRLTDRADVVVSNQPIDLLERWACTPDELLARNPACVAVTVSCYGLDGPHAGKVGNGTLAEAFGGLTHLTGEFDGPPMLPSVALGDSLVALAAAFGAVAACWHRDARGGQGQHVDVAMYEPVIALLGPAVAAWRPGDEPPSRTGSRVVGGAPRNVYACADGRFVVLSGTTDAQAQRVLAVIGHDTDGGRTRFGRAADRLRHADELDALVAEWIATRSQDDALAAFDGARVPVAPVHDLGQLATHPQVVARDSLRTVDGVTLPGPPARLSRTPAAPGPSPRHPTPLDDVLRDWAAP